MPNGTNGDIVSPHINDGTDPVSLQPQPPHFGNINDDAASPVLVVLWDTFRLTTITAVALADTGLDVIEDPDPTVVTTFKGKTVIPINVNGPAARDPAGGTSREYVGLVLAIYRRTPIDAAPGSGGTYLLVQSGDMFIEDLATRFTLLPGR